MSNEGKKNTIGDLIIIYSGLVLIAVAIATFLYLIPSSLNDVGRIVQLGNEITGIPWLDLNSTTVYASLVSMVILLAASLFTFAYHNDGLSIGFKKQKSSLFFSFLMIYILVQLVLSEIFVYAVPNFGHQFPFNQTVGVQNFVFSYLTLEESILYQLIPITIVSVALSVLTGKLTLKSFTFYDFNTVQIVSIAALIALFSTLLIAGGWLDYVSDFISLFVLNIIFLKFGFLKTMLANFSIALTNVTATLISGNVTVSTLLPVYLFFLGFLGVYSLVQISFGTPKDVSSFPEPLEDRKNLEERRRRVPTIEPFIRSRCPDCGNAMYHILLPSMSLKCTKCGLEMEKNAIGDNNIRIELRSQNRY